MSAPLSRRNLTSTELRALADNPGLSVDKGVASLPFTMKMVFQDLFLLSYAIEPDALAPHLPDYIHPHIHGGKSYVTIIVGNIRGMRPAQMPEFMGVNYYQVVYRALVYLKDKAGQEHPGVFFLRSDGNDPVMAFCGNAFTEYRAHDFKVGECSLLRAEDQLVIGLQSCDKGGDLVMHLEDHGEAKSPRAPFTDWDFEQQFLAERHHAFAYDEGTGMVYDLEIARPAWSLRRLELVDGFAAFFQEKPFNGANAAPCSMLYTRECPFVWQPLVGIEVDQLIP